MGASLCGLNLTGICCKRKRTRKRQSSLLRGASKRHLTQFNFLPIYSSALCLQRLKATFSHPGNHSGVSQSEARCTVKRCHPSVHKTRKFSFTQIVLVHARFSAKMSTLAFTITRKTELPRRKKDDPTETYGVQPYGQLLFHG